MYPKGLTKSKEENATLHYIIIYNSLRGILMGGQNGPSNLFKNYSPTSVARGCVPPVENASTVVAV